MKIYPFLRKVISVGLLSFSAQAADYYYEDNCTETFHVGEIGALYVEIVVPPIDESLQEQEDLSLHGLSDGEPYQGNYNYFFVRDDLQRYIYDKYVPNPDYPKKRAMRAALYALVNNWHDLILAWDVTGKAPDCYWMRFLTIEGHLTRHIAMELAPWISSKHSEEVQRQHVDEYIPEAKLKAERLIVTLLNQFTNTRDRSVAYLKSLNSLTESRLEAQSRLFQHEDQYKRVQSLPEYMKPMQSRRME